MNNTRKLAAAAAANPNAPNARPLLLDPVTGQRA
jgi:hypothetical protein